jgi:hypothetical protein
MEPSGLLSCSQEPATSSCPEPDQFNPYPTTVFNRVEEIEPPTPTLFFSKKQLLREYKKKGF